MSAVIPVYRSAWTKLRAPFAVATVVLLFGAAVVAPFSMPSAQADFDEAEFQARINQEFVPNENPEDDVVYADVPVVTLPDPEEERKRLEAEKAAAEAEASKKQAEAGPARYTGGGAPAEWMAAAGIPESEWFYVDYIVNHESSWNPNAVNPSSGTCGLVQIHPTHGVANCTDPVVNLRWGNGYAAGKGGWKAAYDLWQRQGWW